LTASVTLIYELLDPRDLRPHYIGKTRVKPFTTANRRTHPLAERLRSHIAHAYITTPLSAWVIGLRTFGLRPAISKLDTVIAPKRWEAEESFWIGFYISQGFPILNVRTGGRTFSREELNALARGEKFGAEAAPGSSVK
jgi:hypothetical protein